MYWLVLATQPCTFASTTEYSVPAGSGYTALYTGFNNWLQSVQLVLDTQTCTLQQLVTERTGWYWLHSLVHLLQQLSTVYRLVLATQPCTLASTTGYRVSGWYWIHSLVHLLQQLITECTDWYWLQSLVHLLQPTGYKVYQQGAGYTVLTVQCFTPTGYKKKKRYVLPGVRHLTNDNGSVNAAPCRLLARGKSFNVKVVSAPPDHNMNRETVNLEHCHQTGPVPGGTENACQNTKCPNCGAQSACRAQTKPFLGT